MIYIGADHRGYKLKEKLRVFLAGKGYEVEDLGTHSEESVDYPLIAKNVGAKVAGKKESKGVLICGSGAGVCIVANKIDGIRAAEAWNEQTAIAARNDDDANVLCLSADQTEEKEARQIALAFLKTPFGKKERYERRLKEIKDVEDEN